MVYIISGDNIVSCIDNWLLVIKTHWEKCLKYFIEDVNEIIKCVSKKLKL
jgi:hypothetical protein